jgi:hypothetical protein
MLSGERIKNARAGGAIIAASVVALVAVTAAMPGGAHGSLAANAVVPAVAPVDVELAIDGTSSMSTAIARAKSEGVRALVGVKALLPNSRFAVVVFRDRDNPAGEYQLLQPLTSDEKAVEQALDRAEAHRNPTPGNTGAAESYNLAFHQSYSDPKVGWSDSSRKIVVVLGDAEPNGAGAEGLLGCQDRSQDPEGLSTRSELANMRKARRTLIMIRMIHPGVSTSLQCYESLAAGAFVGGAARDAGADIAPLIVSLIKSAYLPVRVRNDLGIALRNSRTGYSMTLRNPNPATLKVDSVRFELPAGFRYLRSSVNRVASIRPSFVGRALSWTLDKPLAPNAQLRVRVVLRTPARVGTYRNIGSMSIEAGDGSELVSQAPPASVRVSRRLRVLALRLVPEAVRRSAPTVSGRASLSFGRDWRGLPAAGRGYGRLVLRSGSKRVGFALLGVRLGSLTPTQVRLLVSVSGSRGYRHCATGRRASLVLRAGEVNDPGAPSRIVGNVRGCGGRLVATTSLVLRIR